MASKKLTVVTHTEPFINLRPIKIGFHLCADYYDGSWPEKDGAMFGKKYPSCTLGTGLRALEDAQTYAQNEGYNELVIERVLSPGITEKIFNKQF